MWSRNKSQKSRERLTFPQIQISITFVARGAGCIIVKSVGIAPYTNECSSKQTKLVEKWMVTLEVTKLALNRHSVAVDITRYLEVRLKEPKEIRQSYSILPVDATVAHIRKASRNNFLLASTMADWMMFQYYLAMALQMSQSWTVRPPSVISIIST
jgi:hypothetical protein